MRLPLATAVLFLFVSPQDPVADAQMLKRAQQLAIPVAQHELLKALAGTWDVTVRTTPPGGAESVETGTMVGKTMLGGRYVVLNFTLQLQGKPCEAVQILGFDTLAQQYTASWRDDHSTWSVECRGNVDAANPERMRMRGTLVDARDAAGRPFAFELLLPKPDGKTVEVTVHDTYEGREFLLQKQTWTRR